MMIMEMEGADKHTVQFCSMDWLAPLHIPAVPWLEALSYRNLSSRLKAVRVPTGTKKSQQTKLRYIEIV
jgi:hypothetical protein